MKPVEHICGIYAILNKLNNKCYIGMSQDIHTRWMTHIYELNRHMHGNKHLENAWHKYGRDNFEFIILKECSYEKLPFIEQLFIALFNTTDSNYGYNLVGGGEGFSSNNKELKAKKSEALRRFYLENPDKKEKRFEAVRAAIRTPEHREKRRLTTLRQFQDENFYKQYRELRSSEEFRKKESESHKGIRQSEESKKKIAKALGKPVICIETGEVFESAKAASRSLPGNINVNAVINGARKSAGGFHWKIYKDHIA